MARDRSRAQALRGAQTMDFGCIDHGLAPPAGTAPLGRRDPLKLALAAQIGFERRIMPCTT
jgi:hypothetical protein